MRGTVHHAICLTVANSDARRVLAPSAVWRRLGGGIAHAMAHADTADHAADSDTKM